MPKQGRCQGHTNPPDDDPKTQAGKPALGVPVFDPGDHLPDNRFECFGISCEYGLIQSPGIQNGDNGIQCRVSHPRLRIGQPRVQKTHNSMKLRMYQSFVITLKPSAERCLPGRVESGFELENDMTAKNRPCHRQRQVASFFQQTGQELL